MKSPREANHYGMLRGDMLSKTWFCCWSMVECLIQGLNFQRTILKVDQSLQLLIKKYLH